MPHTRPIGKRFGQELRARHLVPRPANLLGTRPPLHARPMSKRSLHTIAETRDWSRILLSLSVGIAVIILAAQGDLSAAVLAAAGAVLR